MRLAVRVGLTVLVLSQVFGATLVANAQPPTATDLSIFGATGQLKVPHAVTLHALQILPMLAWLLTRTRWSERDRVRAVAAGAAGYLGLVVVSALQALSGLAPTRLTPLSGALLLTSVPLLAGAGVVALSRLSVRPAPSA
jgi:cytochrome bd-type quinol oxidase subunit 2